MNKNLAPYLGYALLIIRNNTIVLWWVGLLGLFSSMALLSRDTSLFWPVHLALSMLSIVSTPIIYGIYFELIEDRYSSIPRIAKTYVLRYIWLIIRMYLPPIFLASIIVSLTAGSDPGGILELTLVGFSLIYLFVIPTYYVSGTQQGAILAGMSFLGRSISSISPLILAVLLLESAMLMVQHQRSSGSEPGLLFMVFDFLIYCCASIADYIIFIILIFIIKEAPVSDPGKADDQYR
ncbi:MAG: hypothetical protein WBW79_14695 [Desulfocapsaceae bacterium]